MINHYFLRYSFALLTLAMLSHPNIVQADIKDYEFKLIQDHVKKGQVFVDVRLIHTPDNHAVPEAIIFSKRLDMAPDNMEDMTSEIEQITSPEAGVYRFKVNLSALGKWRISLAAKIQGEKETLVSHLVVTAQ